MKIQIIILVLFFCFIKAGFSQDSLQYYIQKAEENSPMLQKQDKNNKIIDLDLERFNSIYNSAKINLTSNVLLSPILSRMDNTYRLELLSKGSNDYIGYDLGATNGGQFQGLVSFDQPLFTQKYSSVMEEKANIDRNKIASDVKLTKAEIKQIVTHQYILCIQSQKQNENISSVIKLIKEQIQQIRLLVNNGLYKFTDLKLLEIELENNQIEEEVQKGVLLNNINSLNLLCGINDTNLYQLKDINLTLSAPLYNYSSLFTSKFKLDSLTIIADQNIYNLQYLPQFNAIADAGLNATYTPTPNRLGFSVGLSFKWNLFDGNQKSINNEKSLLQLENIITDKEYFEKQNSIGKSNLKSQIDNLDTQLTLIDRQLIEYNNLIEIYKKEIKIGLVSILELKTVVKDLTMKKQKRIDVLMSKEVLINMYNYWNQ